MLNIFIRPLARQDMLDIWQYTYDTWGASQADSYIKDMALSFDILAESPLLGRESGYIVCIPISTTSSCINLLKAS